MLNSLSRLKFRSSKREDVAKDYFYRFFRQAVDLSRLDGTAFDAATTMNKILCAHTRHSSESRGMNLRNSIGTISMHEVSPA